MTSPANPEEAIGKRVIRTRWVLKPKGTAMKARLVVQDFNNGTTDARLYASTPNMSSLMALIALASWNQNNPTERLPWGMATADISSALCMSYPWKRRFTSDPLARCRVTAGEGHVCMRCPIMIG